MALRYHEKSAKAFAGMSIGHRRFQDEEMLQYANFFSIVNKYEPVCIRPIERRAGMTIKHPPSVATWLLKKFGSGPDKDAVLGDLAEQYSQKKSAVWYWRQSLKAIPVSFFREIQGARIPVTRALGISLLTLAVIALLLSDIDSFWKIGLAAILGGVFVGVLMFLRGDTQEEAPGANPIGDVRIDSSKIPIRGGIGAGILIVILLAGVLVALPELRLLAAMVILAGMAFGGILFLWRRHHA
jgi:hypothetical protein